MNDHTVLLRLSRHDVGQMLDGLRCREESYRKTADYLDGGSAGDFIIEDVRDAEEARELAAWYRRIIDCVIAQCST